MFLLTRFEEVWWLQHHPRKQLKCYAVRGGGPSLLVCPSFIGTLISSAYLPFITS